MTNISFHIIGKYGSESFLFRADKYAILAPVDMVRFTMYKLVIKQ